MNSDYLKYRYDENLSFNIDSGFVSILGNSNDTILDTLLYRTKHGNIFFDELELNEENLDVIRRRTSFVMNKELNIFCAETVMDEIAFGLESLALKKDEILCRIECEARNFDITDLLKKDPCSLGISDKVKMKILSALIVNPIILVLDNVLFELDSIDRKRILRILREYVKKGGIIINFTNDVEETLYGDRIIVVNDLSLACDGKTLSVLNEEKLLKRLNIGLPFIIELNKYLLDYKLIDKYILDSKKLVGVLWK